MIQQLPLAWPAPTHFRFTHFDADGNEATVSLLRACADGGGGADALLLVGAAGVGKTHLLVATASQCREQGRGCAYLALSRWSDFDPQALAALASQELLLVDEIEAIAGRRQAEIALFDLYNRCFDAGCRLLLASRDALPQLPLTLPDLGSRLAAATLAPVQPLSESRRRILLKTRARERGFELDESVLDFLFRRHRRDLGALMELVERLDQESLARQRRVTVPLVRSVLNEP